MVSVSGIYVIINKKNNKIYIGQAQNVTKRWGEHRYSLKNNRHQNRHLQRAWSKDGEKFFQFKILEYCDIDQLNEREQHYLDIYIPRNMCYNIAQDVKASMRGLSPSEETRRKMSEANKGENCSEETRRKIGEANKRRPPISEETRKKLSEASKSRKRPPMSEEQKQKLSDANKGKPKSEETRMKMSEAAKVRWLNRETC
jgi:group I intron endonuclease